MADINDLISPEALKGLDQMNASLERAVAQLDRVAQSSAALDAVLSKYATTVKDTRSAQDGVNNASKEASQINGRLRQTEEEVVRAKLQFARANKTQRDELKNLIVLEDQEAGTLEKLRSRNALLRQELNKLNLETKEGQKQRKRLNSEIEYNTNIIRKNSDAVVKQKMNIGNYQSAIGGLPGPLGMAATAVTNFTRIIVMNPIAGAIAAIIGVIALLIKAFKGTEEGGDRITRVFRQMKAAVDAVFDRIKNLATGLMKIFSGEAKLRDLKGTFSELGDEIKREVELAGQLADMMDRLEDLEIDMIVVSADRKASIDKLMESAADQNKTELERYNLLTRAKKLIDEEAAAQQKLQLTRIANELGMTDEAAVQERINQLRKEGKQITLEEIGLSIATNVDRKRVNEEIAKYINLEEQAAAESRRLVSRMSGMKKAAADQLAFEKLSNEARKEGINITEAATASSEKYFDAVNKLQTSELKFNEDLMESNADLHEKKMAAIDEEAEKQRQLNDLKVEVINSAFDFSAAIMDRQSAKVESAYSREIKAAGDNEQRKEAIEEKYDKKRKQILRKQAIADKAQAIFNIVVDTARAIVKANAQMGPILAAPFIPWLIGLGAIQAATVLAAPLPQYAKGTKSSRGGPAVVGERGREIMISPSGQVSLTGESAHLTMLQAGTKIIPSDETRQILQAAAVSKKSTIEDTIRSGNKEIVEAIKRQKIEITARTGRSITVREGNVWKTYFEKHLQ